MIHRILGNIFISDIAPINDENIDLQKEQGITHILSVLSGPIPSHIINHEPKFTLLQIAITDENSTNIIEHFPETNKFIDSALFKPEQLKQMSSKERPSVKHHGSILIHCAQGCSRSVAVLCAYLMYRYHLTLVQAQYAINRKREDVNATIPNEAFMQQLQLYQDIAFDLNAEAYKKWEKARCIELDSTGSMLRDAYLEKQAEGKSHGESPDNKASEEFDEKVSQLRCKKCRQLLCLTSQLDQHQPPESDSKQGMFIKKAPNSRRIISVQNASASCSHYFLSEPVNWMKDELVGKGDLEGKFQCPKCVSKVGGYSWRGSRCSCGKWMIPAIHLQSAKVDMMPYSG
ncbi:tyrosine protein phosphatase yvh1 [Scheffersomyces spartinae]|uniref:protein-tyrosine-phosphatase n=1 Tax=Scheffersomyces spartinae TaxID=45513 RepID=A0A9P7VDW0_9ASCO|nr:tyrosine protein phosphatase yvh1 [Scheffersomyces spartinae]KAG7195867.1 tyrosine protein phosphatase yvh1 [Scheffersomyces spartinae]